MPCVVLPSENIEPSQIAALRRRRAYIIAQLHNVGKSIRETEGEVLEGQCLPEVCIGGPTLTGLYDSVCMKYDSRLRRQLLPPACD